ncbi:hemolysin D [Adhaeribacter aerolatus]|uniref:Hemolysin D n=1 Tax=Adhaeribacter aerolatus TaxID=670289 RepID=A0A512B0K1_9BACT|nr:efflux RND transporter periplasmic adaptor subunit [Adhaeribacter aerolatus]GEO05485.1 hemolysin D [Adhaeribacter aerolatus]
MLKHIKIITASLLLVFTMSVSACQNGSKPAPAETEEAHTESEAAIGLTQAQMDAVGIQLGAIENRPLKSGIQANGMLDLPPQNKATISSLTEGIVRQIFVTQGQFVKKGQKLVSLEHPSIIQLQEEYLKARSALNYAQLDYQRQKELLQENVIAAKKYQLAEAEYRARQAELASLGSRLSQLGISPNQVKVGSLVRAVSVVSPMHGYVHQIEVNTGALVEPARELFQVVDNHHIHIDLQVFEKDIAQVKIGQKVLFALTSNPAQEYEATIFAVGKAFRNDTKSVEVHAEIKDNEVATLLPGMFVTGRILTSEAAVAALPDEAIITEGDLKFVFAAKRAAASAKPHDKPEAGEEEHEEELTPDWTFQKIGVQTGVSDAGFTEVKLLEPLPADTQLVTKGAYYVAAQANKGEGGHH